MQFHRQSNIIPRQEDALHFRVASFKSFTAKPPIGAEFNFDFSCVRSPVIAPRFRDSRSLAQ